MAKTQRQPIAAPEDGARSTGPRYFTSTVSAELGLVGLINDDLAALAVEADIDVDQLLQSLADLVALFRIHQENHEAAAAGAEQLAADGAGLTAGLVDFVDVRIRDAVGQLAFELP